MRIPIADAYVVQTLSVKLNPIDLHPSDDFLALDLYRFPIFLEAEVYRTPVNEESSTLS